MKAFNKHLSLTIFPKSLKLLNFTSNFVTLIYVCNTLIAAFFWYKQCLSSTPAIIDQCKLRMFAKNSIASSKKISFSQNLQNIWIFIEHQIRIKAILNFTFFDYINITCLFQHLICGLLR